MRSYKHALELVRQHVNRWDPLRLIDADCPEDEYDCISLALIGLLSRNASDREVFSRLDELIEERFGSGGTPIAQTEGGPRFVEALRSDWTKSGIKVVRNR